jgi:hypothetical protein
MTGCSGSDRNFLIVPPIRTKHFATASTRKSAAASGGWLERAAFYRNRFAIIAKRQRSNPDEGFQ